MQEGVNRWKGERFKQVHALWYFAVSHLTAYRNYPLPWHRPGAMSLETPQVLIIPPEEWWTVLTNHAPGPGIMIEGKVEFFPASERASRSHPARIHVFTTVRHFSYRIFGFLLNQTQYISWIPDIPLAFTRLFSRMRGWCIPCRALSQGKLEYHRARGSPFFRMARPSTSDVTNMVQEDVESTLIFDHPVLWSADRQLFFARLPSFYLRASIILADDWTFSARWVGRIFECMYLLLMLPLVWVQLTNPDLKDMLVEDI